MHFTKDLKCKISWLKWILNIQNVAKVLIESFMGDDTDSEKLFFIEN